MNGWVKIHKKIQDWEWYTDSQMVHLFLHLLLKASFKDTNWKGIEVRRGQVLVGRQKLSTETGISEQSIRTCLDRLKSTSTISSKSTNRYSIITVLNYNEYQLEDAPDQPGNQPASQPATNQQSTTSEEGKEVKKEKNTSFKPSTMKPDWIGEEEWGDLIAHRKAVKATNTERAYKLLISQLQQAVDDGSTVAECIDAMSDRAWTGFKAVWMKNIRTRNQGTAPVPYQNGITGIQRKATSAAAVFALELLEKKGAAAARNGK